MSNFDILIELFKQYKIPYIDMPTYGWENHRSIFYPHFDYYKYLIYESFTNKMIVMERRIKYFDKEETFIDDICYSENGLDFFKEIYLDWTISNQMKQLLKLEERINNISAKCSAQSIISV